MGCVLTKKKKLHIENLWICPLSSVGSRESQSISGRQFSSSFPITSPFHLPPNGQLSFRVMWSCSQSKKWFLWNWASATLRFRGRVNSDVKWESNTEWPPISITVSFKNFICLFVCLFVLVALDLCFCVWAFSSCEQGLLSSCSAQAYCNGFSSQSTNSRVLGL